MGEETLMVQNTLGRNYRNIIKIRSLIASGASKDQILIRLELTGARRMKE